MPQSETVIATKDGASEALLIHRDDLSGAEPGVLLLTDIMGVREVFIERANKLAEQGYVVLLPNIFYRSHALPLMDHTPTMTNEQDRDILRGWAKLLDAAAMTGDGAAYVDFLKRQPMVNGEIGVAGYCLTGMMAVYTAAARPDDVLAAASYHGGRLATDEADSPHRQLDRVKARLYFGHASNDASCPAEMIATLEEALDAAGSDYRSEMYAAGHGFSVKGVPAYDEASEERHWKTLLELFSDRLK